MVNNSIDITSAIRKPFTNIKNLVIGLILFNVPIINIFAPAYFFRCIRGTYSGHTFLPDWKDIKDLMKDWIIMFVIGLTYMIIPIGFALLFFKNFSNLVESISQISLENASISEIILLILSNKPFLVFVLIVAIAVYFMNMTYLVVNDKRIKKISANIILKKAFTIGYFIGFILITVVELVLGPIISMIPIVGQGISNFLLGVISFTLFAQVYLTISK